MQALRSLIYTTLFILVTAFFGVVVLVSALLPLSIKQRYIIPRTWGLFLTWLAGVVCGLKYVVEGQENLPQQPFISLWKHSSSWDTLAQMFVVPPAAWSLKREVIWIPIVGWAVRTFNPIAINRSAGHSAVNQVISQGRERLASGLGIVVYPEGTRVLPGQTRKYGISGALLATKTGAPVVPIAHNSGYFWKRRASMNIRDHPRRHRAADRPDRPGRARDQCARAGVDRGQDRRDHRAAGRASGLTGPRGHRTHIRKGWRIRPACSAASSPQPQKKSARTGPTIALPVSCATTSLRNGAFDSGLVVSIQTSVP